VVFLLENESNCCSRCAYLRAGAVTAGAADGGECSLEQLRGDRFVDTFAGGECYL
jgi:hypothetical protein